MGPCGPESRRREAERKAAAERPRLSARFQRECGQRAVQIGLAELRAADSETRRPLLEATQLRLVLYPQDDQAIGTFEPASIAFGMVGGELPHHVTRLSELKAWR